MTIVALVVLFAPASAGAVEDDGQWASTFALPGADGAAQTSVEYQEDLILGGDFTHIGTVAANHVARWDGESWYPLGEGLDRSVRALTIFEGELYAAGDFDYSGQASVQGVARWDGEQWQSLGESLDWYSVKDLEVFDGQLVAGGIAAGEGVYGEWFEVAGIVTWDGAHWQELAEFEWDHNCRITTMAVNSLGLAVAGYYPAMNGDPDLAWAACWDGLSWSGMDQFAFLRELRVVAGLLLGNSGSQIYGWNGADWQPIISGQGAHIGSFAFIDGRFVAGLTSEPQTAGWVGEWNGTSWDPLGGVFSNLTTTSVGVSLVTSHDGQLIASGKWVHTEGAGIPNLATWNGAAWVECMALDEPGDFNGLDHSAYSLGAWNDQPIVAGRFELSWRTPLDGLELWSGTGWEDSGPAEGEFDGGIQRFGDYQGELVAGGSFTTIGGVAAQNLAAWDGTQWRELAGGNALPGSALLTEGTDLYVGGYYPSAGGRGGGYVARWDGFAWSVIDSSLNGTVKALVRYDGELIAAGLFSADVGGQDLGYIARWDGSAWSPLGGGVSYRVSTLAVWEGLLVVGGEFAFAGGQRIPYLAAWDGTDWRALPGEIDGKVGQAAIYQGDLLVAGEFDTVAGQVVNGIARWDGATWTPLASGLTQPTDYARLIYDLQVIGDELYVAGAFQGAGGKASYGIAHWTGGLTAVEPASIAHPLPVRSHPNPFNPSTEIVFTLTSPGRVTLSIHDPAGRHVRTLLDQSPCPSGETRATWDGRDGSGARLPSGVYLYTIETEEGRGAHKAVMLK